MNFNKVLLAAAISLGMASTAQAATGTITFNGEVQNTPCSISAGNLHQSVDFGILSQAALNGGGKSNPEAFEIKLTGCDTTTQKAANVTFNGNAGHGDTFGVTGVANVGVLINYGGTVIKPGDAMSQNIFDGDNTIGFQAEVMGDAATANPVGTGTFQGVANFQITYA